MALFLSGREESEAAFRVLIHRHGPMVLGICRRVLGDEHAAEDAFQATFLVLVKKAGRLRDSDRLTNWLYGVAMRVASKEKARGVRRRVVERQVAEQTARPGGDSDQGELRSVIDEEIRRLPERYRVPLVLCHVEGLRHDEVAQRLGCPVGTVESRLSRARERLRARLARRGLTPTASALGTVLKPPGAGSVIPSLVEATLAAVIARSARRAGVSTTPAWGLVERIRRLIPGPIAGAATATSALVIAAVGLGILQADGETPRSSLPPPIPAGTAVVESTRATVHPADPPPLKTSPADPPPATKSLADPPRVSASPADPPRAKPDPVDPSPRPERSPAAVARPMSGISIDGRLDDWPKDLPRFPIDHQLLGHPSYDDEPRAETHDPDAYFMVGYDRGSDRIYLAVVVRDDELVVHRSRSLEAAVLTTDAVEVYVDGSFSERWIPPPSGNWLESLDAATMPVLQYVAVPGRVGAYRDRWGANPSLVYSRTRETRTRMRYRREGDVTTYEWAIQAYDRYPDRPTRLFPGKRVGFDVAVVDKDADNRRPAWLIWGSTRGIFKGFNAGSLGELILADGP
jgi:RNA polymerase sigma factor (sigma-70 family)